LNRGSPGPRRPARVPVEVAAPGGPQEDERRVTTWSIGEQALEYGGAQAAWRLPWHVQTLGDVVGMQKRLGDSHRGEAGGVTRTVVPGAGRATTCPA
jgi:hypothetical protein